MRKEFSQHIEKLASENESIIFITGDLGFMALENVQQAIGERFVNGGVSEQNIITMAAAMASEGLIPICYSIAPFIVFRPAEQIRLDVCLHNMNVKIVGNGGGYGYGIMGATHHAIEDIAVLSSFQNMRCFVPFCNEDVETTIDAMFAYKGPSYLRLGYGEKPSSLEIPAFSSIRQLGKGDKITIIGMGSIVLNAFKALENMEHSFADIFVISEIPIIELSEDLKASITKTQKVLVIEEHVCRGGIGEHIASLILKEKLPCKDFGHLFAKGYPNGLYGSQSYHQEINNLDSESILKELKRLFHG